MINRAALILKYKKPAIAWINEADPYNDNPGITLDDVNTDCTVYLLRQDVAETPEALEAWIKLNLDILFENELNGWYNDPNLWPQNRNYSLFKKWFTIECHTVLEDTLDDPIIDEDI